MLVGLEASAAVAGRRTGVGHFVANLAAGLRRVAGPDVDLLLFSNQYDPEAALDGVHLNEQDVSTSRAVASRMVWMQTELPRSLRRARLDVCHFPNHLSPISGPSRHTVLTIHDMSVYRYPGCQPLKTVAVHRALLPSAVRQAGLITADSESIRHDILDRFHISEDRVRVVYGGVGNGFQPDPRPEDAEILRVHGIARPYVLCVGTMEPRKNQARLVEAFLRMVQNEGLPHRLVLVGADGWKTGPLRNLLARGDRGDASEVVRRLGYVPAAHLPALYRGAEAFAFPSLYEGFGLPVLEAMASGTPTLISTDGALREIAGDATISVDPYHTDDISAGLLRLLSDRTLSSDLRERGLARARDFSWDRCAAETLALYREVAAVPRGATLARTARSSP